MIVEFDIKFVDDTGTKYRWEGGTTIRLANGELRYLDSNQRNETTILEIKANLEKLLELGE